MIISPILWCHKFLKTVVLIGLLMTHISLLEAFIFLTCHTPAASNIAILIKAYYGITLDCISLLKLCTRSLYDFMKLKLLNTNIETRLIHTRASRAVRSMGPPSFIQALAWINQTNTLLLIIRIFQTKLSWISPNIQVYPVLVIGLLVHMELLYPTSILVLCCQWRFCGSAGYLNHIASFCSARVVDTIENSNYKS